MCSSDLPSIPGYEIERELGRGGMGVVYKARQRELNRPVAIKMILGGKYTDPVAQARFLVEAEVIAWLSAGCSAGGHSVASNCTEAHYRGFGGRIR